jgi:hypothetical protein
VFSCCYGLEGKSDDEIRDAMSDRFPKHIYACRISQSPSATRKAMKKSGLRDAVDAPAAGATRTRR